MTDSLGNLMPETHGPRLNPEKLQLSKWTAVNPRDREKHFLVTRVIHSKSPATPIQQVVLEAVLTHRRITLDWTELADKQKWLQGWL